jgi:tripartite-type tricarboxylate transporter receptor subunit TctC
VQSLAAEDLVGRLRSAGYESASSTSGELAARLQTDMRKWERVVRDAGIPSE